MKYPKTYNLGSHFLFIQTIVHILLPQNNDKRTKIYRNIPKQVHKYE